MGGHQHRDFLFQSNYISGNDAEGIMYEISYNAAIISNAFIRNGLVKGPTNPGFPTGAIYISESGSDARIRGDTTSRSPSRGTSFATTGPV